MPNLAMPVLQRPAETSAGKIPVHGNAAAEDAKRDFRQLLGVAKAMAGPARKLPANGAATAPGEAASPAKNADSAGKSPDPAALAMPASLLRRPSVTDDKTVKPGKKPAATQPKTAGAVAPAVALPAPMAAPVSTTAQPEAAQPPGAAAVAVIAHPAQPSGHTGAQRPASTAAAAPQGAKAAPVADPLPPQAGFAPSASRPSHSAAPAHAAAQLPAITAQLANALQARAAQARAAQAGARLALHIALTPETLGRITVRIAHGATGDANVTITASQPETLATLKKDTAGLNQILTNAGVAEASRQIEFRSEPVAAAQSGAGLGNAADAAMQGGSGGQQAAQDGTRFANPSPGNSPTGPATGDAAAALARPKPGARGNVDVIA